jgi:hypothetical protein
MTWIVVEHGVDYIDTEPLVNFYFDKYNTPP